MQGCYLLHFDRPIYRAQHYLGWAKDIAKRVAQQHRRRGARLVAQALSAGIGVDLVRVWPEVDKAKERALKRSGPKSYCPRCRLERTRKPEVVVGADADALVAILAGQSLALVERTQRGSAQDGVDGE